MSAETPDCPLGGVEFEGRSDALSHTLEIGVFEVAVLRPDSPESIPVHLGSTCR